MANYKKVNKEEGARVELHDRLALTGAEISINSMPAGAGVPFIHSHKENEEIYYIVSGNGKVVVDGEDVPVAQGDWVKIAPQGKRQFFAQTDLVYICIQVKENSLQGYTADDAMIG